jgi:hypothetical protein
MVFKLSFKNWQQVVLFINNYKLLIFIKSTSLQIIGRFCGRLPEFSEIRFFLTAGLPNWKNLLLHHFFFLIQ